MRIYVSHLRRGDYEKELYKPLLASSLSRIHTFILPHKLDQKPFNTKELFSQNGCDLVIAEITSPATGQGIELGWANIYNIPIFSYYKKGSDASGSALAISTKKREYSTTEELLEQLTVDLNA